MTAEHQRIDTFKLWCWRRFLRVTWTARRSNLSILKEINTIFIGRTDAEAETPILCPLDVKSWFTGKDPDAGKDWGQEETGVTEDKMAGWRHRLDTHEFGWSPGAGDGQGGLVCCDSWGRKESDTTYGLSNNCNKSPLIHCKSIHASGYWMNWKCDIRNIWLIWIEKGCPGIPFRKVFLCND